MEWNGGCRIPLNCNDKSTRCIYRLCQKESTCIMDQSYYVHFWVENDNTQKILELKHFKQMNVVSILNGCSMRQQYKVYSDSNELIGFFDVLKIMGYQKNLFMIHPSIVQQVSSILQKHVSGLELERPAYVNNFLFI